MSRETLVDEVADYELDRSEWTGPGRPPLVVISTRFGTDERAHAADPVTRPLPLGVAPVRGDRWLDYGAGYGTFSILAARRGAAIVLPVEVDPLRADCLRRTLFLEEARAIRRPAFLPSASDVVDTIESLELDAVRLSGAPWVELPARVSKVIERVERRRLSVTVERLEARFRSVVAPAPGYVSWAPAYVYAWGRR